MKSYQSLLASTLSALVIAGCAGTHNADLELQAAEDALANARNAHATDCATETFASAEQVLAEARALANKGENDAARAKAQEAANLANQARAASPPGCDKLKDIGAKKDGATDDAARNLDAPGLDTLLQTIYFDYNEAQIREDGKVILSKIADTMSKDQKQKIEIEGHCDKRGSTEYNLHLGERRAQAVQKYLITQGVTPDQVSIISYGEERPADMSDSEEGYSRNRRAELKKR